MHAAGRPFPPSSRRRPVARRRSGARSPCRDGLAEPRAAPTRRRRRGAGGVPAARHPPRAVLRFLDEAVVGERSQRPRHRRAGKARDAGQLGRRRSVRPARAGLKQVDRSPERLRTGCAHDMSSIVHDTVAMDRLEPVLIDCDIHIGYETLADLLPYLDPPTHELVVNSGTNGLAMPSYPWNHPTGWIRHDLYDRNAGNDSNFVFLTLDTLRARHLDAYDVTLGIVEPDEAAAFSIIPNAQLGARLCSAYNDWLLEQW